MEQKIPSPYLPKISKKVITDEEMEAIKKLLGVKCVFIVADTEGPCNPSICTGHDYTIDADGFTDEQLAGIIVGLYSNIEADLLDLDKGPQKG